MSVRRWSLLLSPLLLGAAVYAALVWSAQPLDRHRYFGTGSGVLVMAHRGGRALGPENTLLTFGRAVAAGADVLEMDVRLTADDHLVVFHDDDVARVTDGRGAIGGMSLAQVQKLDAGYRWSADGEITHPWRGQGLRVPQLDEVFHTFSGVRMNLEIKDDSPAAAQALCATVRGGGMTDRVLVASFHDDALGTFRAACPEVATAATPREGYGFLALHLLRLSAAFHPTAQAFQVPERWGPLTLVDRRAVDELHDRRVQVHVWTVNEPEAIARLLDLGVDGLITDRPDLATVELRQRGRR